MAGTIDALVEGLDEGAFLPAGTVVARIEADDFTAALARTEAEAAAADASLAELEARIATTRAMLAIESEALALRDAEAERLRSLERVRF